MDRVLADWRTAGVAPRLAAALQVIETLVTTGGLSAGDVAAASRAGVTEAQLDRAVHVATAFTIIVRIADTFGFAMQTEAQFAADARALRKRGYAP